MLDALHFLRPWWLLGLVPVVVVLLLWMRSRKNDSHWESQIAPELLAVLLDTSEAVTTRGKAWFLAAALGLATLGLAGPSWERLPQPVTQKTDATIIILDLSLSMFSQDLAPSRLIRARQKITDILRLRREGLTGLIAYAGDPHVVSPLTNDTRTITNLLSALSPEMMPVLGSNAANAVIQAQQLFDSSGFQQGRIILITDGITRPSQVAGLSDPNFPISILGVGTPAGGLIPLDFANQSGQVLTRQDGTTVIAQLNENTLAALTDATYGRYRTLALSDADILELASTPLPSADETAEQEREFDTWADLGYWTGVCLLPLGLLGFRRGVLACLCILLLPTPAFADWWDDVWQRRDQQAYGEFHQGRPKQASDLFADPQWRASAQYRNEDFARAALGFLGNQSATGLYNHGNAQAKQGNLEQAIAAYTEALSQDPQHEDAKFNKALVEKLLEAQQDHDQRDDRSPNQQGDNQQDSDSDQDPSKELPDGELEPSSDEPSDTSKDEQPQADKPGDQQPQEQVTQSRDEQSDALEQWLRRVPDDPGGLLQRKFRYETNQRLRRGDYQEQSPEQIW